MKQVDLYLGFTSCRGNCLFCRKGNQLVHFPRSSYYSDTSEYLFFHAVSREKLEEWVHDVDFSTVFRLNISGNDPIEWLGLDQFLREFRYNYPHIAITLRISNTHILSDSILHYIDKIEMSLYGYSQETHDSMMDSQGAWEIFHINLNKIQTFPGLTVQFQTIFLYSNIMYAHLIISYLLILSSNTPVKLVYPHFMPLNMMHELIPKTQYIKLLLKQVTPEDLKRCILHNFPNISHLKNLFFDLKP